MAIKRYLFDPKEDITTFELAKCMPYLLHGNPIGLLQHENKSILRHWKEI